MGCLSVSNGNIVINVPIDICSVTKISSGRYS